MKLALPPLEIGPDDGFENTDIFGYKDFGGRLADIVEAFDSSTVIVLDGPWGSGKTTFTQQWAGLLRQRGHAVAQFDAFAHDYQDDAFVALAGKVYAHPQHKETEGIEDRKKKFLELAASVSKTLPSMTARVVLNLVTQGALPPTAISKLVESIESAQTSQLEKRIEKAREGAKAVNEFRECLSELAGKLATASPTAETQTPEETPREFVFIIDELDRCKPTFALSLLERVKHLFSVDEICFVLVAHLPELARMVEKEYGVTSGQRYLEKFYHRRVTLPIAPKHPTMSHTQYLNYLNYLIGAMNVRMDDTGILVSLFETLPALAGTYGLSLRTFEHVVRNVALVGLATNRRKFRSAPLIAGLCVMRVVDPELYEKARTERLRTNEALQFLRLDEWHRESVETVEWLKDAWIYATATDEELKNTPDYERIRKRNWGNTFAGSGAVIRSDMITKTCEYIDDLWHIELA